MHGPRYEFWTKGPDMVAYVDPLGTSLNQKLLGRTADLEALVMLRVQGLSLKLKDQMTTNSWCIYYFGILIGYGIWPQFCGAFGP